MCRLLEDDGAIPNNDKLPLLVYRHAVALPAGDPASLFEELFTLNEWGGSWRDGILPIHHFHSTAHEVLGVYSGSASVQFGGDQGITVTVEPGDVVIVPAGVGHKKLSSSVDLGVVGAYPKGQHADMQRGERDKHGKHVRAVASVALPECDPVYGKDGPLSRHWRP